MVLPPGVMPYVPIIIYETALTSMAMMRDLQYGTTRNTVRAAVGAIGAFAGAQGGAWLASTYRHKHLPIAAATVIGATAGGALIDWQARSSADKAFDQWGYGVSINTCNECGKRYKCRPYDGQSRIYCWKCTN